MIQGVLFDMDGVLFDTERLAIELCGGELEAMGYTLPDNLAERICGVNHELYRATILELFGQDFDFDAYDRAVHKKNAAWLQANGVPQKPALAETLQAIQALGLPMAVASSTRTATVESMLQDAGVRGCFQAVIGGDMVQNSKPDPEIFQKAAAALGLTAAQCLAVEDSVNGVRSAAASGAHTVMIPDLLPPTDELRILANAILGSLSELPAYIEANGSQST